MFIGSLARWNEWNSAHINSLAVTALIFSNFKAVEPDPNNNDLPRAFADASLAIDFFSITLPWIEPHKVCLADRHVYRLVF
jgi:hypothetical protein